MFYSEDIQWENGWLFLAYYKYNRDHLDVYFYCRIVLNENLHERDSSSPPHHSLNPMGDVRYRRCRLPCETQITSDGHARSPSHYASLPTKHDEGILFTGRLSVRPSLRLAMQCNAMMICNDDYGRRRELLCPHQLNKRMCTKLLQFTL